MGDQSPDGPKPVLDYRSARDDREQKRQAMSAGECWAVRIISGLLGGFLGVVAVSALVEDAVPENSLRSGTSTPHRTVTLGLVCAGGSLQLLLIAVGPWSPKKGDLLPRQRKVYRALAPFGCLYAAVVAAYAYAYLSDEDPTGAARTTAICLAGAMCYLLVTIRAWATSGRKEYP